MELKICQKKMKKKWIKHIISQYIQYETGFGTSSYSSINISLTLTAIAPTLWTTRYKILLWVLPEYNVLDSHLKYDFDTRKTYFICFRLGQKSNIPMFLWEFSTIAYYVGPREKHHIYILWTTTSPSSLRPLTQQFINTYTFIITKQFEYESF